MNQLTEQNRTCVNRFLGLCEDCVEDYESHHPNNLDCPRYKEMHVVGYSVCNDKANSTGNNRVKSIKNKGIKS